MVINPICPWLLRCGGFRTAVERYYRFRLKKACFMMEQNGRWTIVTLEYRL